MNIDDIYTPIEEAKKEIKRRWNDKELTTKVEEFLNGDIPSFLREKRFLCFARHIHSPNYELSQFLSLKDKNDFEIKLLEYPKDIFTPQDDLKYYLGKMYFDFGMGKKGGREILTKMIIDFNKSNGKEISSLKTLWGENFVDFHHRLLSAVDKNIPNNIFDISEWLDNHGVIAEKYYINFLSLFISHGILFENFAMKDEETKFISSVIRPAINEIEKMFGCKPLIVRLLPKDTEDDELWSYYPQKIIKYI